MTKLNYQLSAIVSKTIGYLSIILITNSCGIVLEKEVPQKNIAQVVISSFQKQYPEIKEVKWYSKKVDNFVIYIAKWVIYRKEMENLFDSNGINLQ